MDTHTPEQRSFNMSRIKLRDTAPEISFRKYIWSMGIRGYRTKYKVIGKPDLFFPKKKIALFIDGCFWHKCPSCFIKPKSNITYWSNKISKNILRDNIVTNKLQIQEIDVIRIWEHQIKQDINSAYLTLKNVYDKKI